MAKVTIQQIQQAYEAGAKRVLEEFGLSKPYMTLNQAYKKYGRRVVERWITEGLIDIIRNGEAGGRCRIKREQIELTAASDFKFNLKQEQPCTPNPQQQE